MDTTKQGNLGRGGSSLRRETQTSVSPATSTSSCGGIPRRSQASRETSSLQRVVGLPDMPGTSLQGGVQEASEPMPEPPQLAPLNAEEQQLDS
ncbi:uncharacterized protein LOC144005088 isoform X2 [Festucalex cinctus]